MEFLRVGGLSPTCEAKLHEGRWSNLRWPFVFAASQCCIARLPSCNGSDESEAENLNRKNHQENLPD
jgi:hypothetical protein